MSVPTLDSADIPIKLDILFGHIEIVSTRRWEGNRLILGGYAIHYDRDGKETRRTEDSPTCTMEIPSGKEVRWLKNWIEATWPRP